MKLFFLCLLLISSINSIEISDYCTLCSLLIIPKSWNDASKILNFVCRQFKEESCARIVENADLTTSYPNMYPFIVEFKDRLCEKYCNSF
uniref:Saposin B-type domain-containing protein n=1 Tax=Caenorhabditis tropicalis TaxID=1561998 RepID=A0A1I7UC20_9PELO